MKRIELTDTEYQTLVKIIGQNITKTIADQHAVKEAVGNNIPDANDRSQLEALRIRLKWLDKINMALLKAKDF